jgi:protoporphyrinogen/coproporphyrinogen III oxidase
MSKNFIEPVGIIGAGLAGLTAANYLRRRGVPVILFEAGTKIAGLAQSFQDKDGFSYDFGAHFITNRLAAAIGISSKCRDVKHYGETVLLQNSYHSYPFGLMKVPHFLTSALLTRSSSLITGQRPETARDWFIQKYGKALAEEVAIPLTEAWSGAPASELSSSVGESIPGSIAKTVLLKLGSRIRGRAVACGYNREMSENLNIWHVYPEGGLSLLCQKLSLGIEDCIQLESPVEKILVHDGEVRAVIVNGREQRVSALISTAPCNILSRMVEGTNLLNPLAKLQYRPMVFVNMRFEGRGLLNDVVVWTPEKQFPFFRLTEAPLSMPWLAPVGKTMITVDIGCQVGDRIWSMAEEELGAFCLDYLKYIIPNAKKSYLGCRVLRTPYAYPVFKREYEQERLAFEQSTGIDNLYSIGRNGEFAHRFMEDVYWRTLKKMNSLISIHEAKTSLSLKLPYNEMLVA